MLKILPETVFKDKYHYQSLTPIMKQYLDLKAKHQDCLLLFRLGDFYELFFEDAVITSSLLDLVLTSRDKNTNKIAMCGMPFHSVKPYITKLVNSGYKVAVCEQTESPLEAKKRGNKAIVNREVQNIFTPGTVIDDSMIEVKLPHYLVSVVFDFQRNECCMCFVDLGAREIGIFSVDIKMCKSELENLSPKEIIIGTSNLENKEMLYFLKDFNAQTVAQADSFFAIHKTERVIKDFYSIEHCKSISNDISKLNIQALGAVLEYICLTQKSKPLLPLPTIINTSNLMYIDSTCQKSLEITKPLNKDGQSLFHVINQTCSHAGSRLLHKYLTRPLAETQKINTRLELTKFFYDNTELTNEIRKNLKQIGDIQRSFSKISIKKASAIDFLNIANTIEIAELIKKNILDNYSYCIPNLLTSILSKIPNDLDIKDEIKKAINEDFLSDNLSEGGFINANYHPKLQELKDQLKILNKEKNDLLLEYKKITKIDSLKIQTNNVLGTFIEIPISRSKNIDNTVFTHKQTTINTARFSTQKLEGITNNIVNVETQRCAVENMIIEQLSKQILSYSNEINNLSISLAEIDVFANFSTISKENNYSLPSIHSGYETKIIEGRHPTIEQAMKKTSEKFFVPNDAEFDQNNRTMILTGPNMGGKSTFLRQNALIILMAHIGCFVPAKEAKIGIVDKIFTRIGANDNLAKGQSTFMLEMIETAAILSQATERSFIILDEIGRGTSTYDGVAIASSCVEHIAKRIKSKCIFATHYHEITELTKHIQDIKNYTTAARENNGSIIFEYKIYPGITNKSYGINVAKIAGLPQSVINNAEKILKNLEE